MNRTVLTIIVLALAYLLFVGTFSATEAATAILPMALAVGLSVSIRRVAMRQFDYKAPWASLLARTSSSIVKDSLKVGVFLASALVPRPVRPAGTIERQPFNVGDTSPRDTARRALVILAISASPDRYVIDACDDRSLLGHSLVGGTSNPDPMWPI